MLKYISPKSATPPKILFHYTDIKGLEGIISNQKIWATDHCFLNDKSEFDHGIKIFKKIVANREIELIDFIKDRYDFDRDITSVVRTIKRQKGIYCCSFTGNGNLLSQWRGYCPRDGGYSIGFNSQALSSLTNMEYTELFRCEYCEKEQVAMAKRAIEQPLLRSDGPSGMSDCGNQTFHTHLKSDIQFIAPAFKNKHFKEEAEWRLVSSPWREHTVYYRTDGNILKPYIEFDLPNTAIEKIIIGPCNNPQLAKHALKEFVRSKGIVPTIVISNIPLR